ncbi:MAG TPA: histone deacetylase [Acidobacteriota bacterium]|nr:histone deacetylase [Acidobacteriota bacterium]
MGHDPSQQSLTGWVFSETFLEHNAGISHPECPERLAAICEQLSAAGHLTQMRPVAFDAAPDNEITRVHSPAYMQQLDAAEGQHWDADTFIGQGSPRIARLAAGGVLTAACQVWDGKLVNAFCAVRPPGHHALADAAMGFCLFNNVAVAVAHILSVKPDAKILIVDWDVHHGNGTQAIFYDSASVMYASLHQYPFYPGTGGLRETGRGPGEGFTVNKPLPAGAGDAEFLEALNAVLDGPARQFAPEIVFVSAGFDAHAYDPLANLEVTTAGFASATERVCAFARDMCSNKVVSVLEGGYHLAALGKSVAAHVGELITAGQSVRTGE